MGIFGNSTKTEKKQISKKKKVLNIIVDVLLVVAVIIEILAAYTAFVSKNGNGVPGLFGIKAFAIQSDSMKPEFSKGDLIIDVDVKDTSTLKEQDIITFNTVIDGKYTKNTHRIVKINYYDGITTFTTKGDNASREDYLEVNANEVVGKYVTKLPGVGNVMDFLQTKTGFFLIIVLPVAIFLIYQVIQFFKALFAYQTEKMKMTLRAEMNASKATLEAEAENGENKENTENKEN